MGLLTILLLTNHKKEFIINKLTKYSILIVSIILINYLFETYAQTIPHQSNGRIVFVSDRDGYPEIYTMEDNGSNVQRLTNSESRDLDPAWSPDGTQIAFSSDRNGLATDIYVMDANGINPTNLTNNPSSNDSNPAWSPDGTQIAFSRSSQGRSEIYIINTDGSNLTKLVDSTIRSRNMMPTWSPDGTRIMFTSADEAPRVGFVAVYLEIISVDGTSRIQLPRILDTAGHPDWSPINGLITFYNAGINIEVFTMDSEASNEVAITTTPQGLNMSHQNPSWSPDGTKIAYEGQIFGQSNPDSDEDIYIIDLNTGKNINITAVFDSNDTMPDWQPIESNCTLNCLSSPILFPIKNTANPTPLFIWSPVSDAESYLVLVSSTSTSLQESFVVADVCDVSECSVMLNQHLALGTYTALVQAVNADIISDPSNEITFTILDSQPIVVDPSRLCRVDTPVIDFNGNPPFSYGATQDINGQVVIEDDGNAVRMTGNTWQQVNFPYTVTSQTVLEFDFQSNAQGELHGLGFDTVSNDQKVSKRRIYTIYGTQNWGRSDGGRYDESALGTVHFSIPVGADYTGDFNYLIFVNDHDVESPNSESVFSNVQVCEFVEPVPPLDPTSCSAQHVLAYAPGTSLADDGQLHPDHVDPTNALGDAQGTDSLNFVSLGFGGELIVDMGHRVMNEDGDDILITETTYTDASRSWLVYPEQAIVYASQDLETWIPLGIARKDMGFDLGDLEWARYIRLIDVTNQTFFLGNGTTTDGFDVDAIEALATCAADS